VDSTICNQYDKGCFNCMAEGDAEVNIVVQVDGGIVGEDINMDF
jgi:hypothetical protein